MAESLHKGHRKRVKTEFLEVGFNNKTPQHKMLEMLLFFCLPQGDTNPLAHELLNKYKNIAGVLDAPVEELIEFSGITESNVVLLKLIMPIARKYLADKQEGISDFGSLSEIGDFLLDRYTGLTEENLGVLSLDGNMKMKDFTFVEHGDLGSVGISTRKMIQLVLKTQATYIVIAHNHPSGIALPSATDCVMTENIANAFEHINVHLLDHIIIADGDYISMAQTQKFKYIFER